MHPIRRSYLFVPGNNPGMVENCAAFEADAVILDLEDAVAPSEKDAARLLVARCLGHLDFGRSAVAVRLNSLDSGGGQDIAAVVPAGPAAVIVPKVEGPEDIRAVSELLARHEPAPGSVAVIALLESPLGVRRCYEVARSDPRLAAVAFGAEDFTAALGVPRTPGGAEIAHARAEVVLSAAAAGVPAIDTPFTDIGDDEGFLRDAREAKGLGYKGKLAIHPGQVEAIHAVYTPASREIRHAARVLEAYREAKAKGLGAVALDGRMVDAPVVRRAEAVLELARLAGIGLEESC